MRVLGISGSLRSRSYNTQLLRAAGDLLPEDAEFLVFEGLADVPPYNEDEDTDQPPAAVSHLREAIAEADAVVFATPEYNSSVPGVLKNAIDWASRPFPDNALRNKPVVVIGASTGMFGAVWAQAELRKVLGSAGARVAEAEVVVGHAQTRFTDDGRLDDAELEEQLTEAVQVLLAELQPVEVA